MVMEKIGGAVQRRPGAFVALNIVIILVFMSSVMMLGAETEMSEENFYPDLPEADANQEILEKYTGEYRISILVRSRAGDLLTPDGLAEMFRLQEALESEPDVVELLEDPANASANFDNPADVVFNILSLNASDEGMATIGAQMDGMALQLQGITQYFDPVSQDNILLGLTAVQSVLAALDPSASQQGAGAGEGDGTYEGSGEGADALANGPTLQAKQAFMQGFTEPELKSRLLGSLYLDPAVVENASASFDSALAAMAGVAQSMQAAADALAGINDTDIQTLHGQLTATIAGLQQAQDSMAYQSPAVIPGVVRGLGYALDIMFTKDYRPEEGMEGVKAKGTMLSIKLATDLKGQDATEAEYSIEEAAQDFDDDDLRLSVIGENLIMDKILVANNDSMATILPIAFLLVFIILFAVYRNGFDIGISLLALVFSIIWVYGYGALMGYTFNPITTVVPVLLVGLGIDYGIHITMRYREEMRSGRTLERSTVNTVGSVGVALLLATITTMIAFLSYVASPISLLAEFGILCAVGIFGAFFSMTTFVPAAKLIRDRRKARKGKPLFTTFRYNEKRAKRLEARERSGKKGKAGKGESGEKGMAGKGGSGKEGKKEKAGKGKEGGKAKNKKNSPSCADDNNNADGGMKKGGVGVKALNRGLCAGATAAERYPATTLIVVLAITLASGYAAYNLDTEFNFEDFLPEDLPISRDIDFLMNEFELAGGEASEVYILVKGDLTSPEVLRAMGETVDNMADDRYVLQKDGAADVDTILTFMAGVASPPETSSDIFSPFDPAFAALYQGTMGPDTLPLETAAADDVSGLYDWLFDNKPKDVKRYLHLDGSGGGYDGSVMRISVMDLDMNAEKITELEDDLNSDKEPLDDADGVDEVVVTGGEILTNIVMTAMNESQLRSMIITIIMTALILSIVFFSSYRSLGLGVITTVPVVLCIFWILGSMYIVGLSLNMMTITLASLTVGLGATYAIHITHRFMEELELGKDPDEAARVTVTHTGSALFGAMATTVAGFGILVFSLLPPMQQFGGIAAIAILFAFLSCAFVLPTMLVLWAKWNVRRGRTWEKH